ncbi:MAG TPA: ABC transporter substrate-binding protein [bacterium]|nr:ABC transporter substrate-binding protein [bacterium]
MTAQFTRRALLRTTAAAAGAGLATRYLGAAPDALAAGSIPNPDTVFYGVYWEPVNLDPHAITDWGSMWMLDNIYEPLVRYQTKQVNGKTVGTAEVGPHLAENVTVSKDGKAYTFRLRQGVKFHSGDPLTADVVKYSLTRMLTVNLGPATLISKFMDPGSITVVDPRTVRVTLKGVCPFFLELLAATNTGAMVNPKTVDAHGGTQPGKFNEWMSRNTDGTGPFKWGQWTAGQQFEFVANDQYWAGAPKLKRVVFRVITDFATQLLLLKRGELDIVYRLPPDMTAQLIGNPDVVISRDNGIGMHQIYMQNRTKPFDDVRVRQAMVYAVDPFAINRAAAFGLATIAQSMLPSGLEGYTPSLWPYKYDPNKAKALLAEAGYSKGLNVSIAFNAGNTEREQTAVLAQAALRNVGVDAKVEGIPWGTFVTNYQDGKMPAFVLSGLELPIVDNYLNNLFHSKSAGAKGNFAFYNNPQVDRLIDQLLGTADPAARKQIITQIQRLINTDVPSVPIYNALLMYAHRSWVKGWVLFPSGNWYFYPVEKRA